MDTNIDENAAPASSQAAPTIIQKETANGVTKPAVGTTTRALWDIADRESRRLGQPAPRKVVTDAYMAEVAGANIATANTQYARWVKFYGIAELIKEQRKKEAEAKDAQQVAAKQEAERLKQEKAAAKEREKAEKAAAREAAAKAKEEEKARKAAEKAAAAQAATPAPASSGDNAAASA